MKPWTCKHCKETFVLKSFSEKGTHSLWCEKNPNRKKYEDILQSNNVKRIKKHDTIAKKFYDQRCVVCGFNDVVDVHHIDENRKNNSPKNLVFLCPNHHALLHRNNSEIVKQKIEEFLHKYWGDSGALV